jgi:hypothetical protein
MEPGISFLEKEKETLVLLTENCRRYVFVISTARLQRQGQ